MTENGNENGKKLFQIGGPGGPGRGKKSDKNDPAKLSDEEFWEEVELLIKQDMISKDAMTRQRAMKLKLMKDEYLKNNAKSKTEPLMTPDTREFLDWKRRNARDFGFDKNNEDED